MRRSNRYWHPIAIGLSSSFTHLSVTNIAGVCAQHVTIVITKITTKYGISVDVQSFAHAPSCTSTNGSAEMHEQSVNVLFNLSTWWHPAKHGFWNVISSAQMGWYTASQWQLLLHWAKGRPPSWTVLFGSTKNYGFCEVCNFHHLIDRLNAIKMI